MSQIKIYISCHKSSQLPNNPLFVPIHVGAKIATKNLEGMIRDDIGENISEKNPQYCELTAQYWAWKNDKDSDYIGLCHYRRFLCFADISKTQVFRNERKHIEAYAIDEFNISRFGLENAQEMRTVIEKSDAVVGELQTVSDLYTPRGKTKTAYEHWIAHDRDLIFKKDLDRMLEILDDNFPDFAKDTREYLNSNVFLGFNCFVLKRKLFEEMCKIEFSVLEKLEKETELSNYSLTQSRIFGFMGEILFSAYIYHLEKRKNYKVSHVPILYFNYTEKIQQISPMYTGESSISVLFLNRGRRDYKFAIALQSFLDNVQKDFFYDILLLSGQISSSAKTIFQQMIANYKNVSLRYIDGDLYLNQLKEKFNVDEQDIFIPAVLLPKFTKMLIFDSNAIFRSSVVPFWETPLSEKQVLAAPYDIQRMSILKGISTKLEDILKSYGKNSVNYFYTNSMLWDFNKYRENIEIEKLIDLVCKLKNKIPLQGNILNILLEGKIKKIGQNWGIAEEFLLKDCSRVPLKAFQEFQKEKNNPDIFFYDESFPLMTGEEKFAIEFWSIARRTPFYEFFLQNLQPKQTYKLGVKGKILKSLNNDGLKITIQKILRKLFPKKTFLKR